MTQIWLIFLKEPLQDVSALLWIHHQEVKNNHQECSMVLSFGLHYNQLVKRGQSGCFGLASSSLMSQPMGAEDVCSLFLGEQWALKLCSQLYEWHLKSYASSCCFLYPAILGYSIIYTYNNENHLIQHVWPVWLAYCWYNANEHFVWPKKSKVDVRKCFVYVKWKIVQVPQVT